METPKPDAPAKPPHLQARSSSGGLLFVPCATVFVSSFCVMVLELVAGRIIARYLGSSLYIWTSVIGVVLAGITIGNYLGGRIADLYKPSKALAILFAACSAGCAATIILNNIAGVWTWLWQFNWPTRVLLHVTLVFLLPSTLLGTISPIVAKMALERGMPTGRTVGDIYAWGAAGSIAGTFAAGYYLIALMGTISIIWAVGAVMLLMALLYGAALWAARIIAVIFLCALGIGAGPWAWARETALKIGLREKSQDVILYEDETAYCYVAVKSMGGNPERRVFVQDKLVHSDILVGEPNHLQYSYEQIMAAVTHRFAAGKENPSFLILGGGGYVLPRYLETFWPAGIVDVVEIDPGVTKAAYEAFGLPRDTKVNTYSLDARNYVDQLTEKQRRAGRVRRYDFVYEDALNDFSVPYQLTTKEFNDKLMELLTDDGIYMIELIDTLKTASFLAAMVNTLEQTFPFVTVISESDVASDYRNTYVVIAAKHKLDLTDVCKDSAISSTVWYLNDSEIAQLRTKANGIILTDDFAPVENLLAPVALRNTEQLARKLADQAEKYAWRGNLEKTMQKLEELVEADPSVSVKAYKVMALIFGDSGRIDPAIQIYNAAFDHLDANRFADQLLSLRYNYASLLKKAGKPEQADEQFRITAQDCWDTLTRNPQLVEPYVLLGNISAEDGDFTSAVEYFTKAVNLNPDDLENRFNLIQAFEAQGNTGSALQAAGSAIQYLQSRNRIEDAQKVEKYLQNLQSQK